MNGNVLNNRINSKQRFVNQKSVPVDLLNEK